MNAIHLSLDHPLTYTNLWEEWRPTSNAEEEVRHRRVPVEQWAAASQDSRDVSA
jgi:hypothetical protein